MASFLYLLTTLLLTQNNNCETIQCGKVESCSCKENRDMGEMTYSYDLKKVEGEWKVSAYSKEMNSDLDLGLGD